jgi:hypothetical protein
MEKKARVQRLSRQDDVKRSWAAAYEDFEPAAADRSPELGAQPSEQSSEQPSEPPPEMPTPETRS